MCRNCERISHLSAMSCRIKPLSFRLLNTMQRLKALREFFGLTQPPFNGRLTLELPNQSP